MKKLLITLAIASAAGCSSASNENVNANIANTNLPVNSNGNSQMILLPNVNAEAFNANTANIPTVNREVPKSEDFQKRTAPDNSEVLTYMRPDGSFAETRTFKDHPQLLKIERVTNGPKVTRKVYLRNGKVYDFTEDQIADMRTTAPGNILKAIGVDVPTPAPVSKKDGNKNEAQ